MAERVAAKKPAVLLKVKPAPEPPQESAAKATLKFLGRKLYLVVSSTMGMVIMLVLYSFLGAVIFKVIEGTHEHQQKKAVHQVGLEIVDNMWNTTLNLKRNEAAFKMLLKQELQKYEAQLLQSYSQDIITPSHTRDWDFWGSLFYSATIVTTIGYGHIYPVTDWGRVATMLYSVLGIPLCLITMADLGKLLTRAIKFLWSFVRRLYYTGRCLKARFVKTPAPEGEATSPGEPLAPDEPYVVDDEFNLPIIVAILVVIIYIFLGAHIYCQWEQWTYLEAFYFIFISVSTIGFGDVLPEHPKYFLASSLYVLMGLSLVAMVINVIMDDMNARLEKAKDRMAEVSRTIGIAIDEDDSSVASTKETKAPSTPHAQ